MTFEIDVGGRRRTVSVDRAGTDRYRVTIDGEPRLVDAVRIGEFGLSMIVDDGGTSREVQVVPGAARREFLAAVDGVVVPVSVDGARASRARRDGVAQITGEHAISAPMPGRVVRVLVGRGDEVAVRQGVIVVEAMKMENELRSPKSGRVKDVTVEPGMSVEAGRVLVVIE